MSDEVSIGACVGPESTIYLTLRGNICYLTVKVGYKLTYVRGPNGQRGALFPNCSCIVSWLRKLSTKLMVIVIHYSGGLNVPHLSSFPFLPSTPLTLNYDLSIHFLPTKQC